MKSIEINSFGPIAHGKIEFSDITFLVGPQASGKSILLQLLKLLLDKKQIRTVLKQYGYVWGSDYKDNLDLYFGEGMNSIWHSETRVVYDGKRIDEKFLSPGRIHVQTVEEEKLFYIPAQRVVCLANGWPRFFSDYETGNPYVLKNFSETLRRLMESPMGKGSNKLIFPQPNRLKETLRESINNSIFHDGQIVLDVANKKRFMMKIKDAKIPFMAWSAGQKEFMPLLLSLYWLCPPAKIKRKDNIKYIVIEEPEMGLHPEAIKAVLLQCIELIARDYKIIISTHSPVLLEFAWVIKYLQKFKAPVEALFELFNIHKNVFMRDMFTTLLKEKEISAYFFEMNNKEVNIKDISSLDATDDDNGIANWGGLSDFASKASELVAKYYKEPGE